MPEAELQEVDAQEISALDTVLAQHASAGLSVDKAKLSALAKKLYSKWERFEGERRPLEIKWLRNLRQFLGEYDPELKSVMDPQRSQAYPRLTRVKCISMLSRVMNMMFPATDKNWSIASSPVPDLPPDVVQNVIDNAMQNAQKEGIELNDEILEAEIKKEADERARLLSIEVEDQLAEMGGTKLLNYPYVARAAVFSGILYGAGVTKGPETQMRKKRTWRLSDDQQTYVPDISDVVKPLFTPVNVWYWYPDMTAMDITRQDQTFERLIYTRSELRGLARRDGFFSKTIDEYIKRFPNGDYHRRTFESELRTMGASVNTSDSDNNKYEIIVSHGSISAQDIMQTGMPVPEELQGGDVFLEMWILGNHPIKAEISPWYSLLDRHVSMFHYFEFEKDDTSVIGNALPNIMRDSQLAVCAAARMTLDNGGVTCGPNLIVNTALLRADQDISSVYGYKVWYRDQDGQEAQYKAVEELKFDSHLPELQQIMKMFMEFADMETFVSPATGGDLQKGPSEPFRTAAGASMIKGDMALPFKDVVRNFDQWTSSIIGSLIDFNEAFGTDPRLVGDYAPVARGLSSLVAKEVLAMSLDNFMATMTDEDKLWIDNRKLLLERAAARDLPTTIFVDKSTYESRKAQLAQQSQAEKEQQDELIRATVRKILSDAMKNLTQADKNTVVARTDEVNIALTALESGVEQEGESDGNASSKPGAGST
jgi:hypothetical protein